MLINNDSGNVSLVLAVGGDISEGGGRPIVVKNYIEAYVWTREDETETVEQALSNRDPDCTVRLVSEPMCEGLAMPASDANGFYTLAEGQQRPLRFYSFEH